MELTEDACRECQLSGLRPVRGIHDVRIFDWDIGNASMRWDRQSWIDVTLTGQSVPLYRRTNRCRIENLRF